MNEWRHTFDVSDLWRNDDLPVAEKGRIIAGRLRAQPWFKRVDIDTWGSLDQIADNLAELPADVDEAAEEFDGWWDEFYDIADHERIWVKTTV